MSTWSPRDDDPCTNGDPVQAARVREQEEKRRADRPLSSMSIQELHEEVERRVQAEKRERQKREEDLCLQLAQTARNILDNDVPLSPDQEELLRRVVAEFFSEKAKKVFHFLTPASCLC